MLVAMVRAEQNVQTINSFSVFFCPVTIQGYRAGTVTFQTEANQYGKSAATITSGALAQLCEAWEMLSSGSRIREQSIADHFPLVQSCSSRIRL